VREFLKREMMAEGYRVHLAKSGREVLKWAYKQEILDLVILDLDLPDRSEVAILEKLEDRIPTLPVVIHAFLSDYENPPAVLNAAALVEKEGNSVERLKKVVSEILGKLNVGN
jgi:DNA-binding NtrC family response regulator